MFIDMAQVPHMRPLLSRLIGSLETLTAQILTCYSSANSSGSKSWCPGTYCPMALPLVSSTRIAPPPWELPRKAWRRQGDLLLTKEVHSSEAYI
jgi:hypothetical protein